MKDILLFPFNGNAKEAISVIRDINKPKNTWNILGFIDDDKKTHGKFFADIQVLGGRECFQIFSAASVLAVPGRPENFQQRPDLICSLPVTKERFATIIHPSVTVGVACEIGYNSLLMSHVVLTANVTIGNNVVILANSVIAHDSIINDYTLLGATVSISGGVRVEENCYIGSGAKIIQETTIGKQALVGLGAVVISDIAPGEVVAGNPARRIKTT